MEAIAIPVLNGQKEAWMSFAKDLVGPRSAEFEDFNERMGLSAHKAWLQDTPEGSIVIAMHDGPGAHEFMAKLAQSDHSFDTWFRSSLEDIHGMNLSEPMPGESPQLLIDS